MRPYIAIYLVCLLCLCLGPGFSPALAEAGSNLTENISQNLVAVQTDNSTQNSTEQKSTGGESCIDLGKANATSANVSNVTAAVAVISPDQAVEKGNLTENESQNKTIIQVDNCSPNSTEQKPVDAAAPGNNSGDVNVTSQDNITAPSNAALNTNVTSTANITSQTNTTSIANVTPVANVTSNINIAAEANITPANSTNETEAVTEQDLSITGTKFNDLNGNGIRDACEPGIAGWMIHLVRNGGETLDTATDADGNYSFIGLEPSNYIVIEDLAPEGNRAASEDRVYNITLADRDATNLDFFNQSIAPVHSDATPKVPSNSTQNMTGINGTAAAANVPVEENFTAANSTEAVNITGLSISGTVFNDLNCSGVRDQDEPGLAGWIVDLIQSGIGMTNTTTDAAGDYRFSGLKEGRYIVSEDHELGWNQTAPASGAYDVSLSNEGLLKIDFGNSKSCQASSGNATSVDH